MKDKAFSHATGASKPQIESLVALSLTGAVVGGLILGWFGAITIAFAVATGTRWRQRRGGTPLLPGWLHQSVWWPLVLVELGADSIDELERWLKGNRVVGREERNGRSPYVESGRRSALELKGSPLREGTGLSAQEGPPLGDYLQRNGVGFVASIAMAIGFFMPWTSVFGLGVAGSGVANMLGDQGILTWGVLVGAIAAGALYVMGRANRRVNVIAGIFPWLLLVYVILTSGIDASDILGAMAVGAYLVLVAGVVLAITPIRDPSSQAKELEDAG